MHTLFGIWKLTINYKLICTKTSLYNNKNKCIYNLQIKDKCPSKTDRTYYGLPAADIIILFVYKNFITVKYDSFIWSALSSKGGKQIVNLLIHPLIYNDRCLAFQNCKNFGKFLNGIHTMNVPYLQSRRICPSIYFLYLLDMSEIFWSLCLQS